MPLFRRDKQQSAVIPAQRQGVPATARPAVPAAPTAPKTVPGAGQFPVARIATGDGDQEVVGLLNLAQARDWPAIRETLGRFSGYDQGALINTMCNKSPNIDTWLPGVVGDGGKDPLARVVLGSRAICRGWEVRTGLSAKHVSADQFNTFHEILRQAEEILYSAVELDRGSAAPWYFLMMSGRGLRVGLPALQRRFEAVVERSPGHLGAHYQLLQALCKKWYGSNEQMHAFAVESAHGPYGDQLGELIPLAHLEHWLNLGRKEPGREYMQSAPVREALVEAADRTINRPDFASPRSPYYAQNVFAMAFGLARMRAEAHAAFEATDGVVAGHCWGYWDSNVILSYNTWRDWSRKKA